MVHFCSNREANMRSSYFHGVFQLSKQVHKHHLLLMLTATLWGRNSFFQCMEREREGQSCEKACPEPGKEAAGEGTQLSWQQSQCFFTQHHTGWTTVEKWPKDGRLQRVKGQVGGEEEREGRGSVFIGSPRVCPSIWAHPPSILGCQADRPRDLGLFTRDEEMVGFLQTEKFCVYLFFK